MRSFNGIIDDLAEIFENNGSLPLKCVTEHRGLLMDVPLNQPTITLGIKRAVMNMGALGAYAGMKNGTAEISVPTELDVKANVYMPKSAGGYTCYRVLTVVVDTLLKDGGFDVIKIESGDMQYKSTFLCNVLPVEIKLRERVCGNTE